MGLLDKESFSFLSCEVLVCIVYVNVNKVNIKSVLKIVCLFILDILLYFSIIVLSGLYFEFGWDERVFYVRYMVYIVMIEDCRRLVFVVFFWICGSIEIIVVSV